MEEMASMTKQNSMNADVAKQKMSEARQIIDKVNSQMKDMGSAISEINRTSEKTGKIIKTIDEIAFQTNLLALNAAVEAARAGEAGAGFAVVADEVRNLAMRAADAARETAELIESTIKAVENGSSLTESTRDIFQENMEAIQKVAELVDEIATASSEQSQGIDQVNKAISEMDRITQSNAAAAQSAAESATEMNDQAVQMSMWVDDLAQLVSGGREVAVDDNEQTESSVSPENDAGQMTLQENPPDEGKQTAHSFKKQAQKMIPMQDEDGFRDF
jgi:methyl-accepting chemotaxis protein